MSVLDDGAFARLYQSYLDAVFNFCLFQTGETATAEDLTAEAFARAWAARARYRREQGEFAAWLFTIARRVVIDWQRRRTRHPTIPLDARTPDAGDLPEVQAERNGHHERLRQLVQALSAGEQELIALKFGAGMTNREIARVLGRSETAIGTAVHQAMRKLRAEWKVRDV
jgi:RNA polymerase sigma-70 factor, ECF subfamily